MTTHNIDFKVKNGLHLNGHLGVTSTGQPNYGTAGQTLVSAGPGSPPVWATPSSVKVSDTPLPSPNPSDLWWDSTASTLKIYYDDGNSPQWVDAVNTTQGALGYTGSQGTQGVAGFTGSQGAAGYTGSSGLDGSTGYTGSQGEPGIGFVVAKVYSSVAALLADTTPINIAAGQFAVIETGDVNNPENSRLYLWNGATYSYVTDLSGAVGLTGPQGIQGYTGSAGVAGTTGFTGSAGIQGDTGFTGSQGATGYTGSAGIQGDTGFTGSQGATGFTGSAGSQGATGYTGSAGIQGDTGFTGSQGATGFTGSQGATGYTGSQGATGYTGSAGVQGIQGDTGFTGSQGATGYTGSAGSQGATGYTGSAGSQGATGYTGSTGFTGATGFTGSIGAQGIQGYTGSAGNVSITDDTTTSAPYYPVFATTPGGSTLTTSSTKLSFVPSTGALTIGYEPLIGTTGSGTTLFYDAANYELRVQSGGIDWNTSVGIVPNGTGTFAALSVYGGSDTLNANQSYIDSDGYFGTRANGTATPVPLRLSVNAVEYFRIGTAGQFGPVTGGTNVDFGAAGQVLTSGGPNAAPTWSTPAGGGSAPWIEQIDSNTAPNPFYLLMAPTDGAQTTYYADMESNGHPLRYDRISGRLMAREVESTLTITFGQQQMVLEGTTSAWSSSDMLRLGKDVFSNGGNNSVGMGFNFATADESVAIGNPAIPSIGSAVPGLSLFRSVAVGEGVSNHPGQQIEVSDSVLIGNKTGRFFNLDYTYPNVQYSVLIGSEAGALVQNGFGAPPSVMNGGNTAVGAQALYNTYGSGNTAVGNSASFDANNPRELYYSSSLGAGTQVNGNNATAIGANAAAYTNEVQLGDSQTTTYVYGTVQNRSDERDKAEIRDTELGLNFIMALRPVDYKWDMRDDYLINMPAPLAKDATEAEKTAHEALMTQYKNQNISTVNKDGSKTRNRYHHGFIAQEVEQLIQTTGVDFGGYQDHTINGGPDVKTIGYDELIAPLVKAIQELKTEFEEYKRTHP